MSTSYNTTPGGLMYCPERDFAYNYPRLVACVRNAFNTEYWPALVRLLEDSLADKPAVDRQLAVWDALCASNDAFSQFVNSCCQDPKETFEQVATRAGWTEVPVVGQVGWMAMLGTVMMGQLFQGLRDVTQQGNIPSCAADLDKAGFDSVRVNCNPGVTEQQWKEQVLRHLAAAVATARTAGAEPVEINRVFREAMLSD